MLSAYSHAPSWFSVTKRDHDPKPERIERSTSNLQMRQKSSGQIACPCVQYTVVWVGGAAERKGVNSCAEDDVARLRDAGDGPSYDRSEPRYESQPESDVHAYTRGQQRVCPERGLRGQRNTEHHTED